MFKVGDYVKGKKNGYGVTNEDMTRGRVTKITGKTFSLKVIEHKDLEFIGFCFDGLHPSYFKLIK